MATRPSSPERRRRTSQRHLQLPTLVLPSTMSRSCLQHKPPAQPRRSRRADRVRDTTPPIGPRPPNSRAFQPPPWSQAGLRGFKERADVVQRTRGRGDTGIRVGTRLPVSGYAIFVEYRFPLLTKLELLGDSKNERLLLHLFDTAYADMVGPRTFRSFDRSTRCTQIFPTAAPTRPPKQDRQQGCGEAIADRQAPAHPRHRQRLVAV
jgi:hypothetical protein